MAVNVDTTTISLNPQSIAQIKSPARYSWQWAALLVVMDVMMFVWASYLAGALVDHNWNVRLAEVRFTHSSVIFVTTWLVIFLMLGLYRRSFAPSFRDEFYFTVVALILGVLPQFILFTVMPALSTSRLVLLASTFFAVILVGSTRSFLHCFRPLVTKSYSRILIVGELSRATALSDKLRNAKSIETVVLERDWDDKLASPNWRPARILKKAHKFHCDRIVLTEMPRTDELFRLIGVAKRRDIRLYVPATRSTALSPDVQVSLEQDFAIPVPPAICSSVATLAKRILDLGLALPMLVLFSPIMALTALLVFIDDGGPILYRQPRVGRGGATFNILKFRTMSKDADDSWVRPGDSRITRLGAFLRRTSLDELPQVINVLRGDMSLVGPRPEMVVFERRFAEMIPSYTERRLALPGITGWAQVNLKRNLSPTEIEAVLTYDLFYIEHWSLYLDLTVMFKTAIEFLFHRAV